MLAFAALLCGAAPAIAQTAPSPGNAQGFALSAGSTVTVAGTGTVITGHVGVSPGTSITGIPAGAELMGGSVTHSNTGSAIAAQASSNALYTALVGTGGATAITAELGGTTLTPGTYSFSSSANIAAGTTLTLNGAGVYIFKVGSAITANVHSSVLLQNGASPSQVFWQVTSAATLNGVTFSGTVVAQAAITLGLGATLNGRALATTAGAVTLAGSNTVNATTGNGDSELFYFDGFDSAGDNGWTHSGSGNTDDWERGTPAGLANDPSNADSGPNVWGSVLGLDGSTGEYTASSENVLYSPVIDCSDKSGITMSFDRWLTVEDNDFDQAEISVNGNLVWSNPAGSDMLDTAWQAQEIDISEFADDNEAVQIAFSLKSDSAEQFGGWNIDDLALTFIPNLIYSDDFDGATDNGWTHTGTGSTDDWERGVPAGLSGDPISAESGTGLWGNNLGLDGLNGNYQPNADNALISPVIDCSGKSGVTMSFSRWLNVEDNEFDQAEISVNGNVVWSNPTGSDLVDTMWQAQEIDISEYADDNVSVQIEFRLKTDSSVELGGWNIDDFELFTQDNTGPTTDAVSLIGSSIGTPGLPVNYAIRGMQPDAPYALLVSLEDTGTIILGQSFDIGSQYLILRTGTADSKGEARIKFALPATLSPITVYFEVGSLGIEGIDDSNLRKLVVQ
jgi:hypothetical protein